MLPPRLIRQYARVAAVLSWITVTLRFYLAISTSLADGTGVGSGILTFLSYFTVLTNILVALAFTVGGWASFGRADAGSGLSRLRQSGPATAIAVYITIVAVIYHVMLSHLWDPQGLTKAVDVMQHSVIPGLYLVYWWLGIAKESLRWRGAIAWLSYPVGYSLYTLLLGAMRDEYPYPFADVNALGYVRVIQNCINMYLFFASVSCLFIGAGRLQARRRRPAGPSG